MSFDSIRGYVQMASGITEASRARAMEVAQGLMSLAGRGAPSDLAATVASMADDVLAQARTNRENLIGLIRQELEELLQSSSSLVRTADLDSLRDSITQMASDLDSMRHQIGRDTPARLISGSAAAMATVAGQGKRKSSGAAPQQISSLTGEGATPRTKRVPPRRRGEALARARGEADAGAESTDAHPSVRRVSVPPAAPPEPVAVRRLTVGGPAGVSGASSPASSTARKAAQATKAASAPAKKTAAAPAKRAAATKTASTAAKKAASAPAKKAAAAPAKKVAATKTAAKKAAARTTEAAPAKKAAVAPATKAAAKTATAPARKAASAPARKAAAKTASAPARKAAAKTASAPAPKAPTKRAAPAKTAPAKRAAATKKAASAPAAKVGSAAPQASTLVEPRPVEVEAEVAVAPALASELTAVGTPAAQPSPAATAPEPAAPEPAAPAPAAPEPSTSEPSGAASEASEPTDSAGAS